MNNSIILRGGADELDKFAMENCLKLYNTQTAAARAVAALAAAQGSPNDAARMYACKTCGRKFHSFQALGGHRASHKKAKLAGDAADVASPEPAKPKTHACTICGAEFPVGQALGGHMRRHRPITAAGSGNGSTVTTEVSVESSGWNNNVKENEKKRKNDDVSDGEVRPVANFSSISKRVCLNLMLGFAEAETKAEVKDEGEEIEGGETVEKPEEEAEDVEDFLKLELRQPIRVKLGT